MGLGELDKESTLRVRDGAADEIVEDQVLVPCLNPQAGNRAASLQMNHATGDSECLICHGSSPFPFLSVTWSSCRHPLSEHLYG